MARQIDGASKSYPKGLDCNTDTGALTDRIAKASRSLSRSVEELKSDLESFVSYLENMGVKEEKKPMAQRILGWLKLLFHALAGISALAAVIAPLLSPVVPGVDMIAPAVSALFIAAAELCKALAGMSHEMPAEANE